MNTTTHVQSIVIERACAILLCMHDISGSDEVGEECVCVYVRGEGACT